MASVRAPLRLAEVIDIPGPGAAGPSPAAESAHVEAMTSLWVVAGLAMAPAVALGFGRFAYALVLPAMRDDLGWSYADAGAMGTANSIGYLGGAIFAATIASRFGARRAFTAALIATALSIAATALPSGYWAQGALRVLTGLGSGVAFVIGGALAAAAASGGGAGRAPTVLGVYVGGVGAGIALSAVVVPFMIHELGWRGGWLGLGALSLVAVLLAALVIGRTPEPVARRAGGARDFRMRPVLFEAIGYGLVGAGYIGYATFVVAYLKAELGFSPLEISAFWTVLGLAIVGSTFIWGPILGRLKGGHGLVATALVMTVGVVLALALPNRAGAFASALLFGASSIASVTAVTTLARRVYPPEAWTAAIGALTVAFGAGQIIGPVLSGFVSDGPHGLAAGLWLSVGILTVVIFVAMLQREAKV